MLLEEALLHLLRFAGYQTVEEVGDDPTLKDGSSGLEVKGRGGNHQIDAIADFSVSQPFGNPERLLVEAKFFEPRTRVGLPIVREAVGILKDVSEYWVVGQDQEVPKKRYHYQYAVFSATGYSPQAERFAFAQDIYLIPLAQSRYFRPVVDTIRRVQPQAEDARPNADLPINMGEARKAIRRTLHQGTRQFAAVDGGLNEAVTPLGEFLTACANIHFALLAVLGGRFPVFLVPSPEVDAGDIRNVYRVRVFREDGDATWYLRDAETNALLFSFDLPPKLFEMYANQGMLDNRRALDLKAQNMAEFRALFVRGDAIRTVRFILDLAWVENIRVRLRGRDAEDRE